MDPQIVDQNVAPEVKPKKLGVAWIIIGFIIALAVATMFWGIKNEPFLLTTYHLLLLLPPGKLIAMKNMDLNLGILEICKT